MRCQLCGLPDHYRGHGDGIGSCDCTRCDCCDAGPEECDCGTDWDDGYAGFSEDPDDEPYDPLCNDPACPVRRARRERAKQTDKERTT